MQKILTIICLILWSITLYSQEELHKYYAVHISDGRILEGEFIAEDEDFIHLKLESGEVISIPSNTIGRMVEFKHGFRDKKRGKMLLPGGKYIRESGAFIIVAFGIMPQRRPTLFGEDVNSNPTFSCINGYQFNKHTALGLGINLDFYAVGFAPVYLNYRNYLTNKSLSWYYTLDIGYAFSFDQFAGKSSGIYYSGGFMTHPSVGIRLASKEDYNFIFEIGYRNQYSKKRYIASDAEEGLVFRRLTFRIGLVF